ncbi:hypothetical protein ACF0H5_018285 [Mactra antiquata]
MKGVEVILVLVFLFHEGVCDTWFKGCYNQTQDVMMNYAKLDSTTLKSSVADCAQFCHLRRFPSIGVQWTGGGGHNDDSLPPVSYQGTLDNERQIATTGLMCVCIDTVVIKTNPSCDGFLDRTSSLSLPVSRLFDIWAIYSSIGPYLTNMYIGTDTGVAVLNLPVAIEIRVRRASAMNVTTESEDVGHNVDITLTIRDDGIQKSAQLSMENHTEILHRPKYTFTSPGLYNIGTPQLALQSWPPQWFNIINSLILDNSGCFSLPLTQNMRENHTS